MPRPELTTAFPVSGIRYAAQSSVRFRPLVTFGALPNAMPKVPDLGAIDRSGTAVRLQPSQNRSRTTACAMSIVGTASKP